jgi:hypothetical protein
MDKEIESILNRTKEIKEIEGIEEWFEDYREEARTIIKKARKTRRKDIAKISLGLTKEQLEDFVIVEFMMADVKLLLGPEWEEMEGKWDG